MGRFMIDRPATAFATDWSMRRQPRIEDPRHLAFIRKLPSVISGAYGCEACHIRFGSAVYRKKSGATAMKADDAWTVPMTREEHASQHDRNEKAFWDEQGIDPLALAAALYEISGDEDAGRRIILQARSAKL